MSLILKNTWGAQNSNLDQQRGDLFRVSIALPRVLGGVAAWDETIQIGLTKFPFPTRERETIPTKYLNQTNHQLGADVATGTIEIPVRYAFNGKMAELLTQWDWMHSHPSGGVAVTSQVKVNGDFFWLVPSLDGATPPANAYAPDGYTMRDGGHYALEGVMIKGLKPSDADMESSNNLVTLNLTLSIDRYYPKTPGALRIGTEPTPGSVVGAVPINTSA